MRLGRLLALSCALGCLAAQELAREEVRETRYKPSALSLAGEFPGERITEAGVTADWPVAAATRGGTLHIAYVEWTPEAADKVVVRTKKPGGAWSEPLDVSARETTTLRRSRLVAKGRWSSGRRTLGATSNSLALRFRRRVRRAPTAAHSRGAQRLQCARGRRCLRQRNDRLAIIPKWQCGHLRSPLHW